MTRSTIAGAVATLCLGALLAGCGDDNEIILFDDCGNGVLDPGEECDDGNTSDADGCLSTCRNATCGDGFVNAGVEECDGSNLAGQSCGSLGLGGGTLACSATCAFDPTGCGQGPVATPTTATTPTPAATPSGDETPTPGPTGSGATCAAGDQVVVTLSLDSQGVGLSGAQLALDYPAALSIPGFMDEPSVRDRVDFAPSGGLESVNDNDTNNDSVDDQLSLGFVGSEAFPDGAFATATFDCVEGANAPTAAQLPCTVNSASDEFGNLVDATCTVSVSGP